MEWISVEKGLPDFNERVFIYFDGGGGHYGWLEKIEITVEGKQSIFQNYNNSGGVDDLYDVTHWMRIEAPSN